MNNQNQAPADGVSADQEAWSHHRFVCDGIHTASIRGMWFVHVPGHREEVLTAMFNTPYLGPWVLVYSTKEKGLETFAFQFPAYMLIPIDDPDLFMRVMGRGLNRFALDMMRGEGGDLHFREIEPSPLPLTFTREVYEEDLAALQKAQADDPNAPLPFGPLIAAGLSGATITGLSPTPRAPSAEPKRSAKPKPSPRSKPSAKSKPKKSRSRKRR